MESKTKKLMFKQSISWNFVFYLLQLLYDFTEIMNDEFFYKKFEELFHYVSDKIATPNKGEISDIYVIVEQEID